MKTVQLIGTCPANIRKTPDNPPGVERWCANDPTTYVRCGLPSALKTWTRWFNVHSPEHIAARHPRFLEWAEKHDGTRPIYTRDATPSIPGNRVFPGPVLQEHFQTGFFTCQCAWLIALAMLEDFERIELWGFQFGAGTQNPRDPKVVHKYAFERPAIHYWIGRARQESIVVVVPPEAKLCQSEFLYGYEGPPL